MAYQISYDSTVVTKKKRLDWKIPKVDKTLALRVSCAVLGVLLLAVCIAPGARVAIRNLLLPGDPEVTAAALEKMVDAIGDGQAVKTALTEFCREVIDGGLQAA